MWVFIDIIVLSAFVTACLFAGSPTILSPSLVKATTDGVVLIPSAFVITCGSPPSSTATQELVVPKSIPITFDIILFLLYLYINLLINWFICFYKFLLLNF